MAVTQIRGAQIKDRAISSSKIALAAIIEELIANSAVTTDKIADLNVTTGKLAAGAVDSTKIGAAAIAGGTQFAASVDVAGKAFTGASTGFDSALPVGTPTLDGHAATKLYVDGEISTIQASVTSLGNAFNYVGSVDGGVDTANAFDLATLAADGKDAGDYYKVTTAGYFKVGAGAEFYANVGDGIVWNTSADVDVIDNTNSTVAGTANEIAVSGSADTGYTVALDAVFTGRMDTAESDISTIETNIGTIGNLSTTATDLVGAINEVAAAGPGATYRRETPSGTVDGANTAFTLANTPDATTVQVYINGLLQEPTDDYALSGTTVTFVSAPLAGDKIRAIYFIA